MFGSTADKPIDIRDKRKVADQAGGLATRKIWLPKLLYDALPYFYMTAGFTAFFATLYISEWFWVLPHYLLFSAACVHLAVVIFRRRDTSTDSSEIDE